PTWSDVVAERRSLTSAQSLLFARGVAQTLSELEKRSLAQCDVSGANVLLPGLVSPVGEPIELVDLDGMFGPTLAAPHSLPAGSDGYAHPVVLQAPWGPAADRFAGAVLIAEMLAWCDARTRELAWGESYFDPDEMQASSDRFRHLDSCLTER